MPNYYQGGKFTLFPTDPRVQSWPCTLFANFTVTNLAASAFEILVIEATSASDNQHWLLGAYNVLSFGIVAYSGSAGLLLETHLGDGNWWETHMFPLTGESIIDTVTGFEVAGLSARFRFQNGVDGVNSATGWIQLRSW